MRTLLRVLIAIGCFWPHKGIADLVHIMEETEVDGVVDCVRDLTRLTGMSWETQAAPTKAGCIFTHWSISTAQEFAARDAWGRALDVAVFKLYEDTTLTAHYMPETRDEDGDGVADGWELYWYGNLKQTAASDTDGDGLTFAEELANGTNPLMADNEVAGPIAFADGELLQYNPHDMSSCVFRSEPEGTLFATYRDIVKAGTYQTSESLGAFGATTVKFAYWTVNGVAQRDAWGRAVDVIAFNMPTTSVEVVAVTAADEETRRKLYWYGTTNVAMDSDTDGDGFTFAAELANGTNPLMPEGTVDGPVRYADGELLQYNPWNIQPYTFRSEPEGVLFATINDYARTGAWMSSTVVGSYGATTAKFAYWVVNGVVQRDAWGRAVDTVEFSMPTNAVEIVAVVAEDEETRQKLYWYGTTEVAMDSDTDGDGFTFAAELANRTNPLMPEGSADGPVRYADGPLLEANLQPYEQITGTIVDGGYRELFTSNWRDNGETSVTFDGAVTPTVVDLDGDGRFDLVVESNSGSMQVFLNGGSPGNPQFVATGWQENWREELAAAKAVSLDELDLDTEPVNPTGCTMADVDKDGVGDLLVGDAEGRVWFYKGIREGATTRYALQNKVWGGTFGGFAAGLTISAVDWDEDGDIDLVCGTADGKLMLLTDPRIGRPVNVQAEAGATSVVLTWDANVNSRVRGYGVYRSADSNNYTRVARICPLPRYRDEPEVIQDYWYRVTGMSRFYTTGNSTPIESESMPTDAVFVRFTPELWLNDTSSYTDEDVEVVVSVNNSVGIKADGFVLGFNYDAAVLEPKEVIADGLSAGMTFSSNVQTGKWVVSAIGGELKTGSGILLKLKFHVKAIKNPSPTEVTLVSAALKSSLGQPIAISLPKKAVITLAERHYDPAIVTVGLEGKKIDARTSFVLPVNVMSTEELVDFSAEVEFDSAALDFKGWTGSIKEHNLALEFYAKDQHELSSTTVTLRAIRAVDIHENEIVIDNVSVELLIHDTNPPVPAIVSISTEGQKVDTLTKFTVTFALTTDKPLKSGKFVVEYDNSIFEHEGTDGRVEVSSMKSFSLDFFAKDQHVITSSDICVVEAEIVDANNFTIMPSVPVISTILIRDANPLKPAGVVVNVTDTHPETLSTFEVPIRITSTKTLKDFSARVNYDASILEFKRAEGVVWNNGVITTTGNVPNIIKLVFFAKDQHTVTKSEISLTNLSAYCTDNLVAMITTTKGTVYITDSNVPVSPVVSAGLYHVQVKSGEEFSVPFGLTSVGNLAEATVVIEWDTALISYGGSSKLTFKCEGEYNQFSISGFKMAAIEGLQATSWVKIKSISAIGANGLAATIKSINPDTAQIMVSREIGKYGPGDLDGDGKLTDTDMIILTGYSAYLKMPNALAKNALVKSYQNQYHVNIALTGSAAKAADVNCDGKVDASDISLLTMLVEEAKGIGQ